MRAFCRVENCGEYAEARRSFACPVCKLTWYFCEDHDPRKLCDCEIEKKKERKKKRDSKPTLVSKKEEKKLRSGSPNPLCLSSESELFPIKKVTKASDWFAGSVGIEFQTPNIRLTMSGNPNDVAESKVIIFKAEEKVFVESDCGELEIVTDPIEIPTGEEAETILHLLQKQFIVTEKLIGKRGTFCGRMTEWTLPEQKIKDYARLLNKKAYSSCSDTGVRGRLQISLSIELERLPQLLSCELIGADWVVESVQDEFPTLKGRSASAFGLICLCLFYKVSLEACGNRDKDGPKEHLLVMCRTDFHTMYNLLDFVGKTVFLNTILDIKKIAGKDLMFPKGYKVESDFIDKEFSITYGEWLDSMITPLETCKAVEERLRNEGNLEIDETLNHNDQPKDLLSPPPFFSCEPDNDFCYAMGKYGAYKGRIIVELRGIDCGILGLTLESAWAETVGVVRDLFEKKPEQK
jgi:hypothetical protein